MNIKTSKKSKHKAHFFPLGHTTHDNNLQKIEIKIILIKNFKHKNTIQ